MAAARTQSGTMDRIFSTAGLHARDRFDCWHEIACKKIVGHESRPLSRPVFEAELEAARLAETQLIVFRNSSMDVTRTRQDITRAKNDELFVCRQLAGSLVLEQCGREVALEKDDFCLLDPLIPYTGQFRNGSGLLVLKVPRRTMEARVGNTSAMTARALNCGSAGHLASGYLGALPECSGEADARLATLLQDQALDLVAMTLSIVMAASGANVSSPRALAYLKLRSALDDLLTDPALSPTALAKAAGLSVRHANFILADHDTSLERFIQRARLERCRRAFSDPSQARRTITEIALGWGFSDPTLFSRIFKRTYGLTPRDYRRQRRASDASQRSS